MENTSGSEVRKRKVEEDQEKQGKKRKSTKGRSGDCVGGHFNFFPMERGTVTSNLVFSSIPGEPVSSKKKIKERTVAICHPSETRVI